MPYLSYITDEHFIECISNLHRSYLNAKNNVSKKTFYKNKVDTIKLLFDSKFNGIKEESLIESEIIRQVDKSINNFIGTFHEQILGGVKGYEIGNSDGYDIKRSDNTLFADIKNKHNTMNSKSQGELFTILSKFADENVNAKCYWVQILAKNSFDTEWRGRIGARARHHPQLRKISGDKFYELVTGEANAFYELYRNLPKAIDEYLSSIENVPPVVENSAIDEIKLIIEKTKRGILDQITYDNYKGYNKFKEL